MKAYLDAMVNGKRYLEDSDLARLTKLFNSATIVMKSPYVIVGRDIDGEIWGMYKG